MGSVLWDGWKVGGQAAEMVGKDDVAESEIGNGHGSVSGVAVVYGLLAWLMPWPNSASDKQGAEALLKGNFLMMSTIRLGYNYGLSGTTSPLGDCS